MASRSLGTLTLDLIAKIGGFTSGMSEAERAADKSAKKIEASIKSIGVAGYAVGNALGSYLREGIDAVVTAFPKLIDQAAQFQDLAEKTGGSAEGLAALAVAAKVGGASMEDVASASVKLTKGLTGVDDESKAAGSALAALGIPLEDFKRLAPEEQMVKVAEALAGFEDGAGKTAVAVDLFGKAGANLLPFLKELYSQGGLQKILTAEQIKQADDYADRLTRQKAEFSLTASAVATQFLPAITALTSVMTDLIKETIGVNSATSDLGRSQAIQNFVDSGVQSLGKLLDAAQLVGRSFDILGTAIGNAAATAGALAQRNFSEAATIQVQGAADIYKKVTTIGDNLISERISKSLAAQRKAVDEANSLAFYARGSGKPVLNYSGKAKGGGGGGAKDDPTKKLLDNDLAAFKAMGDQAKELLADRNKMLDLYNQQGLISVKDYYAALTAATEESTKAQAQAIDDQIAALQKFKAAAKKDTDVADATGKINKLEEEKAKLYRQSGIAAIESSVKQVQAQKAVQDAFNEVNAKVLEFQGNLRAAGEIRFDAQNAGVLKTAMAEGNEEVVRQIALLKQYNLAQADINKAQAGFALAQGDLQIAEERITIARERGTMGEMESLRASGDARKAAVAVMQKQLDTLLAINEASRSPEQSQQVERLKVQLEGLKATIDPLADKFNNIFSDAAGNAFGDFISGTKSAKQAFKDFANSVINEIGRMVAKDLAKSLFAGSGAGSGIGGLFSSLFGGGSTGAAAASSGFGTGSAFGSQDFGQFFASGGYTGSGAANDPAGIVHKGEYVLNAEQTRRIGVSNLDAGNFGGGDLNVTYNVRGSLDPRTANQSANQLRRVTQKATRLA